MKARHYLRALPGLALGAALIMGGMSFAPTADAVSVHYGHRGLSFNFGHHYRPYGYRSYRPRHYRNRYHDYGGYRRSYRPYRYRRYRY